MDITQQLVRVDSDLVKNFRNHADRLNSLLQFDCEPVHCYADFGWTPPGLVAAIDELLGSQIASTVSLILTDESDVLNEHHPKGLEPDGMKSKVTIVGVNEYEGVVSPLFSISSWTFAKVILRNNDELEPGEYPELLAYYSDYYRNLCGFLLAAKLRHQSVVSWWD